MREVGAQSPLPCDSLLRYFWITTGAVGVWLILHINDVVVDTIWYRDVTKSSAMYLSNMLKARSYQLELENQVSAGRKP
jgi:hypothetical protein